MLILFAGYDRSGKDSAFEAIQEVYPEAQRIALADRLKDVCRAVFGVVEDMKDTGAEEYYRMCLTKTSEVMKIASGTNTYFSEYLEEYIEIKNLCASDTLYVCTDGRYDYEIEYFRNTMSEFCCEKQIPPAFFPVKLTRPDIPATKYALENHNFPRYKNFYTEIKNDSDIITYKNRVQKFVKTLLDGK